MMNPNNILKGNLTIAVKIMKMAWHIQMKRYHWRVSAHNFQRIYRRIQYFFIPCKILVKIHFRWRFCLSRMVMSCKYLFLFQEIWYVDECLHFQEDPEKIFEFPYSNFPFEHFCNEEIQSIIEHRKDGFYISEEEEFFFEFEFKRDVIYGYIHEDFQERAMFSFTPVDQNKYCVVENDVNLFQGDIIDDVFTLVFYDPFSPQWLVHDESSHIGLYNTDPISDE
jgi:hypothetical protein